MRRLRERAARGARRSHQLAVDRRGREAHGRRRGQGPEGGLPGSGRPGGRALLSHQGLDARALARSPRAEGGAAAAGREEEGEERRGAGEGRAGAQIPLKKPAALLLIDFINDFEFEVVDEVDQQQGGGLLQRDLRACSTFACSTAFFTFFFSSGGGSTAFSPRASSESSRIQPLV